MNLVPNSAFAISGKSTCEEPGACAPKINCLVFTSSRLCTGEVCHTTETVAVDTTRPIQVSLTGSKSP